MEPGPGRGRVGHSRPRSIVGRYPLDILSHGRHSPRRTLGTYSRRIRRRPRTHHGNGCGRYKRLSGRRPVGARHHGGLCKALCLLRSCREWSRLQHHLGADGTAPRCISAPVRGRCQSRSRNFHVLVQRHQRCAFIGQLISAARYPARQMAMGRSDGKRLELHQRDDKPRILRRPQRSRLESRSRRC